MATLKTGSFDANQLLVANKNNVPKGLTIPEQTLLGRLLNGKINPLTKTQILELLGLSDHNYSGQRGQLIMSTEVKILLNSASWTEINGTFTDTLLKGFTRDGNKLIATNGGIFLLTGISDLATDNVLDSTVYYLATINNQSSGNTTKHGFDKAGKFENISICKILELNAGDYIKILAKASGDDTITVSSLVVTLTEI